MNLNFLLLCITSKFSLLSSVKSVIEAYKSSLYVQVASIEKAKQVSLDAESLYNSILRDAIGFIGANLLFLCVLSSKHPDQDMFGVSMFPEMNWGDKDGWRKAVLSRQCKMGIFALQLYDSRTDPIQSQNQNQNKQVSVQDIISIFSEDDKIYSTEHLTEYWHP